MALNQSEVQRIRYELGYNVLAAGAEPYIGVHAVFDQVIAVYLKAGASTTSSTAVVAAAAPAPVALTLTSAIGFAAGCSVVVDVDARQEVATVQSLAGAVATVLLSLAHAGTYPVSVEGGESMVREILGRLRTIASRLGGGAIDAAGVKKVDEIEFFAGSPDAQATALRGQQTYWRCELAGLLGVQNLRETRSGSALGCVLS